MSDEKLKIVTGLNLGSEGESALELANWLAMQPSLTSITAVFVLEDKILFDLLGKHDLSGAAEAALQLARSAAASVGAADTIDAITVGGGDAAPALLERAVADYGADLLLIGRDCGRREEEVLGRVGKALLKSLPVPTVVTPRVLDQARLANGPVLVAMTPDAASVPAFHFAANAAQRRDRELVLVHVAPGLKRGAVFPDESTRAKRVEEMVEEAHTSMSKWMQEHGLTRSRLEVVLGEPGQQIPAACERERASMVVCGSRRKSSVGRLFSHSVSLDLAAATPCPIVVVPGS